MVKRFRSSILAATLLSFSGPVVGAPTETIIHSNQTGLPAGGLVTDKDGVLYGVVFLAYSAYVYSLTPPKAGGTDWRYRAIYKFPKNMGYDSSGSLTIGTGGVLYGTLRSGAGTGGIVFQLTPPSPGTTSWTETDLYDFPNSDLQTYPVGPLLRTANGDLYGTVHQYSKYGGCPNSTCGEVFKLSPPSQGGSIWSLRVLYNFLGQADGGQPNPGLIKDASGAIYGTAMYDGMGECVNSQGCGTVFKLTPPANGQKTWTETTLYSFTGGADGGNPNGNLILDSTGILIGTTANGGATCSVYGCGVIFSLSPPTVGQSNWTESVLWTFQDQAESTNPVAGLIPAGKGTYLGATLNSAFRLIPPGDGQSSWNVTVLHNFVGPCSGTGDLLGPTGTLVRGMKGAIFGAATDGGPHCRGGVFEITQ